MTPTKIKGSLYDLPQGYPCIVLDNSGNHVIGELYKFKDMKQALQAMDQLEGFSSQASSSINLYNRVLTLAMETSEPSKHYLAWVYEAGDTLQSDLPNTGILLKDGMW